MRVIKFSFLIISLSLIFHTCQTEYTQGERIYQTQCANCHMPDGKGLHKLYPPLAGSDYLRDADVETLTCLILNGSDKGVTVNGVHYTEVMPGVPTMRPAEITNVLNFIRTHWENDYPVVNPIEVDKAYENCRK